jgi:hypothetical protein
VDDEERFGFSLALKDGDLAVEGGAGGTPLRLQIVSGKANLVQALELRVLTPFGSDPFNTRYGLDVSGAFLQSSGLRLTKELIRLSLVQTLGVDPRVQDIREVVFEDEPGYRLRHPEISPQTISEDRRRRFLQVEVVILTLQNQAQALSFQIGV